MLMYFSAKDLVPDSLLAAETHRSLRCCQMPRETTTHCPRSLGHGGHLYPAKSLPAIPTVYLPTLDDASLLHTLNFHLWLRFWTRKGQQSLSLPMWLGLREV